MALKTRKNIFNYTTHVLTIVLVLLSSTTLTFAKSEDKDKGVDMIVVDEVVSIVSDKYVNDIEIKKLIEGALMGVMHSVDDYSDYLSPSDYKDFKSMTDGSIHGIGVEIARRNGVFSIASVIPGSPAEIVGIKPGDIILEIDNMGTGSMSIAMIANVIRGNDGSVELRVGRTYPDGRREFLTFRPKRTKLVLKPVSLRIHDDILIISILSFTRETYPSLLSGIKNISKRYRIKDIKGAIIDLRDNPGGLLEQAVDVSGLFLGSYTPIVTVHAKNGRGIADFVASDEPDILHNVPIVVLVNENTSSASEILAASLQENNRAAVIGSNTYGKGAVQDVFELFSLPGAAIKLTFAMYRTPLGHLIEGIGVKPDMVFDQGDTAVHKDIPIQSDKMIINGISILNNPEVYQKLFNNENHPAKKINSNVAKYEGKNISYMSTALMYKNNKAFLHQLGNNKNSATSQVFSIVSYNKKASKLSA